LPSVPRIATSETIHWPKPYEALADALSSADNDAALKELDRFLKHWYKDLAGTGWHDSHKPDENGNQGGYYGYWSFEAGARAAAGHRRRFQPAQVPVLPQGPGGLGASMPS
jgi:hypothetical protein